MFSNREIHARSRTSAFTAKTDASGLAVISNLPVEASEFSVDHPEWTLRPVTGFAGQQYRQQSVTLAGGQTNHINVKLERRNASVIRQY